MIFTSFLSASMLPEIAEIVLAQKWSKWFYFHLALNLASYVKKYTTALS